MAEIKRMSNKKTCRVAPKSIKLGSQHMKKNLMQEVLAIQQELDDAEIREKLRDEEQIRMLSRFPDEDPSPVLRVDKDGTILYNNKASQPLRDFWSHQGTQALPDELYKLASEALS
jgi:transcriptional regulator with PAS, ATPase and Fis domain